MALAKTTAVKSLSRFSQVQSSKLFPSHHKKTMQLLQKRQKILRYSTEEQKEIETQAAPDSGTVEPETKLQEQQQNQQVEKGEEQLGIVGTSIMWAFLIFLFAGSLFFTFGRSFQEDLQPLDPQTIIEMTS
eukprot:TRINITY_DN95602_c0_g1_i1.p3 TRINITY_DN95602_c0_g1~~TRINITY_DN95602_c0_g1_i1.p3  ORF type:complete len:142 (-),score=12.74 TRINITY_DN95602_c0_g1_i1:246-638(-)